MSVATERALPTISPQARQFAISERFRGPHFQGIQRLNETNFGLNLPETLSFLIRYIPLICSSPSRSSRPQLPPSSCLPPSKNQITSYPLRLRKRRNGSLRMRRAFGPGCETAGSNAMRFPSESKNRPSDPFHWSFIFLTSHCPGTKM
jgi:hypothetical protein